MEGQWVDIQAACFDLWCQEEVKNEGPGKTSEKKKRNKKKKSRQVDESEEAKSEVLGVEQEPPKFEVTCDNSLGLDSVLFLFRLSALNILMVQFLSLPVAAILG